MFFKTRFILLLSNFKIGNLYSALFIRRFETSAKLRNSIKNSIKLVEETGYGYGKKIVYNSTIEKIKSKQGYKSDFVHQFKKKTYKKRVENILETVQPLPLSLKYYSEEVPPKEDLINKNEEVLVETDQPPIQSSIDYLNLPLSITHSYKQDLDLIENNKSTDETPPSLVDKHIQMKYEVLKKRKNWMTAYDNFEHDLIEDEPDEVLTENWTVNYGTPNPNSKISSVPCGGCGALLHCKVNNQILHTS